MSFYSEGLTVSPAEVRLNIDYTQGYGSFYFFPGGPNEDEPKRPTKSTTGTKPKGRRPKTMIAQNAIERLKKRPLRPRKESTPFPLMKLPVEIRRMIYNFVLEPLTADYQPNPARILVELGYSARLLPEGPTEWLISREAEPSKGTHGKLEIFPWLKSCLVGSAPVGWGSFQAPLTTHKAIRTRNSADYNALRRLSHVSRPITQELGQHFWDNATLEIQYGMQHEDIESFIDRRPAAVPRIKSLTLEFAYIPHLDIFMPVAEICATIAQYFDFRTAVLIVWLQSDSRSDDLDSHETERLTAAFRRLKVRERFEVHVRLVFEERNTTCVKGNPLLCLDAAAELQATLQRLWMPDTLRDTATTDEAVYRRERPALLDAESASSAARVADAGDVLELSKKEQERDAEVLQKSWEEITSELLYFSDSDSDGE